MTFGAHPIGSSSYGSKIISFMQTIEEINRFENAQVFFNSHISIFHRHFAKCEISIISPEVEIALTSPTIEITVI